MGCTFQFRKTSSTCLWRLSIWRGRSPFPMAYPQEKSVSYGVSVSVHPVKPHWINLQWPLSTNGHGPQHHGPSIYHLNTFLRKMEFLMICHLASTGATERAVETFMKAWTWLQSQSVSPSQWLACFLSTYRNMPHTVMEHISAELFLKHQPSTCPSLLKPDVSDVVSKQQQKNLW